MIIAALAIAGHATAHGGSGWAWVQWVFSGIGVAVVSLLGTWLFRKRKSSGNGNGDVRQKIKSGHHSVNIQVGNTGSPSDSSTGDQ